MSKFVINQTETNIGLFGSKYLIPIGGWLKLTNEQAATEEVIEAVRRGWIKISATEPAPAQVVQPKIEISEPPVMGSKTPPKKKVAA